MKDVGFMEDIVTMKALVLTPHCDQLVQGSETLTPSPHG